MNKIHQRRMILISLFVIGLAAATGLILFALKQNINVFMTPSQLTEKALASNYHFRLGGMVKLNSVKRETNSLDVTFVITDYKRDVTVHYHGILPDLFREGKGVIAEGRFNTQGEFIADQVLAKHDENYMPKNVYRVLRENKS